MITLYTDIMDTYSEAEIQVLIVLIELAQPKETPNNNFYTFYPKTVEEAARYFKSYRVDWAGAYPDLAAKGLISKQGNTYVLTPKGIGVANQVRDARPPIWYWYKQYYSSAPHSRAYATFCERLYGKALCQTNFSDMAQLDKLIEVTRLNSRDHVLDLGCGAGFIAEYVSDRTGASFTGIDYSPEAIAVAQARTAHKRHCLSFQVANMDSLDFPSGSFSAILSIDTLYMPNDLDATLRTLMAVLKPGGQMAVFYSHMLWDTQAPRESLLPENTPLGTALMRCGLPFQTWDFSAETYRHLQQKRQIGLELKAAFEAEGNQALYDYIMAESEGSTTPFDPATATSSRYLYHVRKR
ncbi:MAG: methyltransferase domain-containing protein [Chloroflexi bacterium]|nr:methyltransferase domain-containing protein [Chloroflexota bacterium]